MSHIAGVMELADVLDSKSSGSDTVRVRPPLPAPCKKTLLSTRQKSLFTMISVPWHERVIYLRYDIALRAMIYAFGIWGTDIISYLQCKYIIRLCRISYCGSDISLKKAPVYDIISIEVILWIPKARSEKYWLFFWHFLK